MKSTELQYAKLQDLFLDPKNARLGRENTSKNLSQAGILELMRDWTLDELAVSFVESGFWPHEALLVVKEVVGRHEELVVIEGNRRLAALKCLFNAVKGGAVSGKWSQIAKGVKPSSDLFSRIPFIEVDSRQAIESFLGFRHVTGIKEWHPAEKAEFIARMIEQRGMPYDEVMRKIGSKTSTVRQHYISYRLLLQMEATDAIDLEKVEEKFSVLYLSLRTEGVQKYLGIDIEATPAAARRPVPRSKLKQLANFALWLFGDAKTQPVVQDSRQVDNFGKILNSKKAVAYLERSESPTFETAFRMSGGTESEVVDLIDQAADSLELALGKVHLLSGSKSLHAAIRRVGADALQLLKLFPAIEKQVREDLA